MTKKWLEEFLQMKVIKFLGCQGKGWQFGINEEILQEGIVGNSTLGEVRHFKGGSHLMPNTGQSTALMRERGSKWLKV